jgi:hypothetical protein
MTTGGWTASVLCVVALVVVGPFLYRLGAAVLLPAPQDFSPPSGSEDRATQFLASFDAHVKQLDGRSMMYIPGPPGSDEGAPVEEVIVEENGETPTRYDGPSITAIVLDTVWFNDGKRLRAGDDEQSGLKVLSTQGPWGARVLWRGAEFTVPFFERDKVVMRSSVSPKTVAEEVAADTSTPPPESSAPKTAETPSPAPTPAAPPPPEPQPDPAPSEPQPEPVPTEPEPQPEPNPEPPSEPQGTPTSSGAQSAKPSESPR